MTRAHADGFNMRAPYPSFALFFHAVSVLCLGNVAFYRGDLYRISSSAWALSAAVGALGLLAPLALSSGLRARLLAGPWPLAIVLPWVALFLGPGLVPSPLTVGPFLFCAGASLTTCVLVVRNVAQRKRSLRRLLTADGALDDALARKHLETYFAASAPLAEEGLVRVNDLYRALRAQAWIPGNARRASAAEALRAYADYLDRALEAETSSPVRSNVLESQAEANRVSAEQMREACSSMAAHLGSGGRLFRWRTWLVSLSGPSADASRDWFYAVGVVAKRHGVACPQWFQRMRRALGRAVLTPTDVAPPWKGAARLAKPVTVVLAVIVVANALLSTATAQAPPTKETASPFSYDARPLPVIAGPSAESRIEPRFSRVVSTLADRRAQVRCWSPEDWEMLASEWARWPDWSWVGAWGGYTSTDHERVNLPPAVCVLLTRLAYQQVPVEEDGWPDGLAWSVGLLTHEAQHVRGVLNEARAECYGMQSISTATQALGRTGEEGRYLARLYWQNAYPDLDPEYRSSECRNGGRLDLHPQGDAWP